MVRIPLIKRPEGLLKINVRIEFNLQLFECLEVDLSHINKNQRSFYNLKEIQGMAQNLIDGICLVPSGEKRFYDEFCTYYVLESLYNDKMFKLVFCICSDRPKILGMITLHRV